MNNYTTNILRGLLLLILFSFVQLNINAQRKDGVIVITTPIGATHPIDVKEHVSYKYIIRESSVDFDVVFYIEKHSKSMDVLRYEWQRVKAQGNNYIFELIIKRGKDNFLNLLVAAYGGTFGYTLPPKEGNQFKYKRFADEIDQNKKEKIPLLLFYEENMLEKHMQNEIDKLYKGLLDPENEKEILSDMLDITDSLYMITYDIIL